MPSALGSNSSYAEKLRRHPDRNFTRRGLRKRECASSFISYNETSPTRKKRSDEIEDEDIQRTQPRSYRKADSPFTTLNNNSTNRPSSSTPTKNVKRLSGLPYQSATGSKNSVLLPKRTSLPSTRSEFQQRATRAHSDRFNFKAISDSLERAAKEETKFQIRADKVKPLFPEATQSSKKLKPLHSRVNSTFSPRSCVGSPRAEPSPARAGLRPRLSQVDYKTDDSTDSPDDGKEEKKKKSLSFFIKMKTQQRLKRLNQSAQERVRSRKHSESSDDDPEYSKSQKRFSTRLFASSRKPEVPSNSEKRNNPVQKTLRGRVVSKQGVESYDESEDGEAENTRSFATSEPRVARFNRKMEEYRLERERSDKSEKEENGKTRSSVNGVKLAKKPGQPVPKLNRNRTHSESSGDGSEGSGTPNSTVKSRCSRIGSRPVTERVDKSEEEEERNGTSQNRFKSSTLVSNRQTNKRRVSYRNLINYKSPEDSESETNSGSRHRTDSKKAKPPERSTRQNREKCFSNLRNHKSQEYLESGSNATFKPRDNLTSPQSSSSAAHLQEQNESVRRSVRFSIDSVAPPTALEGLAEINKKNSSPTTYNISRMRNFPVRPILPEQQPRTDSGNRKRLASVNRFDMTDMSDSLESVGNETIENPQNGQMEVDEHDVSRQPVTENDGEMSIENVLNERRSSGLKNERRVDEYASDDQEPPVKRATQIEQPAGPNVSILGENGVLRIINIKREVIEEETRDDENSSGDAQFLTGSFSCASLMTTPGASKSVFRLGKHCQMNRKSPLKFYKRRFKEGWRAHEEGSQQLKKFAFGFPERKFNKADWLNYPPHKEACWDVQAVYSCDDPSYRFVVYEGWMANTGQKRTLSELMRTARDFVKECELRDEIFEALRQKTGKEFIDAYAMQDDPKSIFWCYEDVSYYVNQSGERHRPGKIFFALSKSISTYTLINRFPKLEYIDKNLLTPKAREVLLGVPFGQSICDIIDRQTALNPDISICCVRDSEKQCPSDDCKCDYRFKFVYNNVPRKLTRFKYKDEVLNVGTYHKYNFNFLIECSDACGCGADCPARFVQKGQQTPLALLYDIDKNFEVRAGKKIREGEFIVEYTGVLMTEEEVTNPGSYVMTVVNIGDSRLVIDATNKGNVARFMNHSCEPNAMFLEVHSRVKENELLVPRVGVFALKDIEQGEEITIDYFMEQVEKSKNTVKCSCKSAKCRGRIPRT